MDTVGVRLKKIRLEKGLSLEEVQKKTKIHLNVLKAIEEDSFVNLSPIYIRGFLKIYCQFLGVDPKDYISAEQKSPSPTRDLSVAIGKPASLLESVRNIFPKMKIIFSLALTIFLIIGLFKLGKFISYKRNLKTEKVRAKAQPAKITAKQRLPITAKKEQVTKSVVPKVEDLASGIKLGIRAKYDDCWIELKVDGQLVFKNMLKKGRFEIWQAKEKIDLSLGNAGAVELEINGKRISSLGRRGQSIKNISISKEGMVVPR